MYRVSIELSWKIVPKEGFLLLNDLLGEHTKVLLRFVRVRIEDESCEEGYGSMGDEAEDE